MPNLINTVEKQIHCITVKRTKLYFLSVASRIKYNPRDRLHERENRDGFAFISSGNVHERMIIPSVQCIVATRNGMAECIERNM